MAPKKKKKPAANPARAVATTSIASKPKVDKKLDSADASETGSAATPATPATPGDAAPSPAGAAPAPRELHQLSPEELEQQLERNELQLLVEKHAQKVRKESSRHITRVQTDRRVLRTQAQYLPTREWLPGDLTTQILDLIKDEINEDFSSPEHKYSIRSLSEEDVILRLWTLSQTLADMGFSKDRVRQMLVLICRNPPPLDANTPIWGLQESLEWFAVNCPPDELPPYESQALPPAIDTSSSSRSNSPKRSETPASDRAPASRTKPVPTQQETDSPAPSEEDFDVSDLDSDMEPDQLLETYINAKSRLFQLNPDLVATVNSRSKSTKKSRGAPKTAPLSGGALKLQKKIQQIESDALFDQREADEKWASKRVELAREAPGRPKRLKETKIAESESLAEPESNAASAADDIMQQAALAGDVLAQNADDDDGLLGEEACRARDSGARLTYKHVSPTTYSSRHSVTITWTKDQEPIDASAIPDIICEVGPRSATFTMIKVATPGTQQSEAYVSVVALFLVFSVSSKEEKVYMRLPPTWRDLWAEFSETQKNITDEKDREMVKDLRGIVQETLEREDEDGVILMNGFKKRGKGVGDGNGESNLPIRSNEVSEEDAERLKEMWHRKTSTPSYQRMLAIRSQLPMAHFREAALSAVERNQVVILCGETGCGKSTQLPAFVLEHELSNGRPCKVYCTEPRRISAISLAQRVSEELASTRLVYATVGIVLRMLESSKGLDDVTHLVIDEVHERSIDTDFLLIVLRALMVRRPELKVILMSATVDADRFSKYLDGAPIVTVPGRTFPVQTKFLEDAIELTHYDVKTQKNSYADQEAADDDDDSSDGNKSGTAGNLQGYSVATRNALKEYDEYRIDYELIIRLVERVAYDPNYTQYSKAILIFLPGIAEIRQLNDMLVGHESFAKDWLVYPLHSTIASEDQQAAFLVPPPGVRKIVLATNIAETGITIPDITCVVDTGKHKEMRFDERRQLSRLIQSFISRANAKQRRGRAGRVQEGLCFHLFTKYRHDELMAEQQTPEMLRLSLQDLVMRVKICKLGEIEPTLSQALDPPSTKNIRRAIDALIEVDALTASEELTPLGRQMAKLPLDANLGKLALLASIFGCVDVAITIAAILSSKDPFLTPFGQRQRADLARLAFRRGDSDLLTAYNAYATWRKVCTTPGQSEFQFCQKNFLSRQNLANIEDLKSQLLSSLADANFVALTPDERHALSRYRPSSRSRSFVPVLGSANANNQNDLLIAAVIAWSFYPKLLTRDGKGWRNVASNQSVSLAPTSVNKQPPPGTSLRYLSYYHIMQSGASKLYNAHSTSVAHDVPLALFAGAGDADARLHAGVVALDGNRLRFAVKDWKTCLVVKVLRQRVRDLINALLRKPGPQTLNRRQARWLELFLKVFDREGRDRDTGSAVRKG
ncbi:Helicase [Lasiodiplodia theobromae]|uniref:Helicase n=1 Tax=Lasiodiplodia theobromae TaxID=45133 RepID=UPI0015C3879C|nr:Helicase [Lasiodiplodia theobromae]KAF4540916.1 Helicase [Lasiodiplodia theobromae]